MNPAYEDKCTGCSRALVPDCNDFLCAVCSLELLCNVPTCRRMRASCMPQRRHKLPHCYKHTKDPCAKCRDSSKAFYCDGCQKELFMGSIAGFPSSITCRDCTNRAPIALPEHPAHGVVRAM
jgi:hypothetical protein